MTGIATLCNITRAVAYVCLVEDGVPLADEDLHITDRAVFEDKAGACERWLVLASLLKGRCVGGRHFNVRIAVEEDDPR